MSVCYFEVLSILLINKIKMYFYHLTTHAQTCTMYIFEHVIVKTRIDVEISCIASVYVKIGSNFCLFFFLFILNYRFVNIISFAGSCFVCVCMCVADSWAWGSMRERDAMGTNNVANIFI